MANEAGMDHFELKARLDEVEMEEQEKIDTLLETFSSNLKALPSSNEKKKNP